MLIYSLDNDNDQLFPSDAATLFAFVECYDHKILMLQHYLHLLNDNDHQILMLQHYLHMLIVMITKFFTVVKKYQKFWPLNLGQI